MKITAQKQMALKGITTEKLFPGMLISSKYFDDLGIVICLKRFDKNYEFKGKEFEDLMWEIGIIWSDSGTERLEITTVWTGYEWRIPWNVIDSNK